MRLAAFVTPSFRLHEFFDSSTATRLGVPNFPPAEQADAILRNIVALGIEILGPLRGHIGRPITIESGYRSPQLNVLVNGQQNSQHCKGQAADIKVQGWPTQQVFDAIVEFGLPFDQLILEYTQPDQPYSGWVHVSYDAARQRGQKLAIDGKGTRVLV